MKSTECQRSNGSLSTARPVRIGPAVLALALSVLVCQRATAAPLYSLIDLGVPDGVNFSEGIDINDRGQVAVRTWESGYYYGFVWENGRRTVINTGSRYNSPSAINNDGTVVGYASSDPMSSDGFVWKDGKVSRLGHIAGGQTVTRPHGINDNGQVVGYSLGNPHNSGQVITWADGKLDKVGIVPVGLGGSTSSQVRVESVAHDINNAGQVVGCTSRSESIGREYTSSARAWLLSDDGSVDVLARPPHLQETDNYRARAINNYGQIVGVCVYADNETRPVLWDGDSVTLLDALPGFGCGTSAGDINDQGMIVGVATAEDMITGRAVLWDTDRQLFDLNDLLDASGEGWTLNGATAINSLGWIVGGATDPFGDGRGFLLIPAEGPPALVPEPCTPVILAIALACLLPYVWRRRQADDGRGILIL